MERAADELKKEMQPPNGLEDDDLVPLENVGTMQATAEFDEMVVWSHESIATAVADPYVRSVEEWLQVADKVCHPIYPCWNILTVAFSRFIRTTMRQRRRKSDRASQNRNISDGKGVTAKG